MARYWNLRPWEFRALAQEQQAELHAIWQVEQEIEGYYTGESLRKSENPHSGPGLLGK